MSLPRSIDVQINVAKAQTETRTPLDLMCVVAATDTFTSSGSSVRVYSSISGVAADMATDAPAYLAAQAFFSQTPRAARLAIAETGIGVTTPAVAAYADFTFTGSNMGSGTVTVTVTGLQLGSATVVNGETAASVVSALVTSLNDSFGVGPAPFPLIASSPSSGVLRIASTIPGAAGNGTTVVVAENVSELSVSTTSNNQLSGGADAVTASALSANILNQIQGMAGTLGEFVYGWCLTSDLRNLTNQVTLATWALSQDKALAVMVTNDPDALNPAVTTDLGSVLKAAGNRRAVALYHDNATAYPDVSILAYMLHVNYRLQNSAVTAKFKVLPGIPTVNVTESQWSALKAKGYNTYTAVGNAARTFREGGTEDITWYMDTIINIDNFVEDLSVAVYNVFLRNKKVPYTRAGQMLLVDACTDVGALYVYNGVFADRDIADLTSKSGYKTLPAVDVVPTPIYNMTAADRASRIGPPIAITVQESGAIHSIALNVEVVS